ncbi:hypothetical protein HBI82_168210 [Parastagonospora nodorum]|nr:hypothetical protein HBH82_204510 [Parastagonospora nodorum]KAH4670122.1 hypothetical protein HBH78_184260 [Parastagonospora nodorum]KAH4709361.1 hypothetical protein HBH67_058460 [Parastagonospora nodorum]KAH4762411.1 hypothetical protein HBH63_200160 [Parastagonospora nodorum]KAH4771931.1 hypothetical protein HBH62_205800 [Parastagonospora nodorum]
MPARVPRQVLADIFDMAKGSKPRPRGSSTKGPSRNQRFPKRAISEKVDPDNELDAEDDDVSEIENKKQIKTKLPKLFALDSPEYKQWKARNDLTEDDYVEMTSLFGGKT